MIAKLKGILDTIGNDWILVDVQGVGYRVHVSHRTLSNLPDVGTGLSLWIVMLIRQEMPSLFGFFDVQEQETFETLITVQGVGAKVALAILSVLSTDELALAIHQQDKTQILRADGVGPKLASRLLTELKDKIITCSATLLEIGKGQPSAPCAPQPASISDVFSALENLGYRRSESASAVAKAIEQHGADGDISLLIRTALGLLSLKLTGTV